MTTKSIRKLNREDPLISFERGDQSSICSLCERIIYLEELETLNFSDQPIELRFHRECRDACLRAGLLTVLP